jgi:hypothetical protein
MVYACITNFVMIILINNVSDFTALSCLYYELINIHDASCTKSAAANGSIDNAWDSYTVEPLYKDTGTPEMRTSPLIRTPSTVPAT